MTIAQQNIIRKELSTLRKSTMVQLQKLDTLEQILGSEASTSRSSRKSSLRNHFEMNHMSGSVKKPAELKRARS